MCELSSFPRSQLSAHLEVCPNQPLPCPFLKTGCKADLTRRELKDHLQTQLQDHLAMVVDKLEMVETRNRNLEGLLAESEKREDLRNDRETEMQARISLLESRLDRCEKATQMHGAGWADGEPDMASCEPLSSVQGRQPSWTPDRNSTQDEDSLSGESAHVDTSGFIVFSFLCSLSYIVGSILYTFEHFSAGIVIIN